MSEPQKDESQKTVVSFIVGLLVGGLLVWAFSGSNGEAPAPAEKDDDIKVEVSSDADKADAVEEKATETKAPTLQVGTGKVEIGSKAAGLKVPLASATYPVAEGWIGVRQYDEEKLGYILGVVRFSESQGLVPSEIVLQYPTTAGRNYAITVFTEDGDRAFNSATDRQLPEIITTFKAE
jgi:hypothetical protein